MNRFFHFYNNIVRPEILLKYDIKNIYSIPRFKSIDFYILLSDLKTEEDLDLIKSFHILEFFCLQRPYIKKFFIGSKQGKKSVFFLLKCTLRKKKMYNFLDYFIHLALPYYAVRQLKLKVKFNKDNNNICIFLKDLNVFFKMPDRFLSFNKGFFFIIRLSNTEKNKKNNNILFNFLKIFNFYLKK
jgi:ribosomal protein L5